MFIPFHDDNPTRRPPLFTVAIIAVNVVALVWVGRMPEGDQQRLYYGLGFVPARIAQLFDPRPLTVDIREYAESSDPPYRVLVRRERLRLPADRQAIVLSLLTCMFLHGGWLHLLGNMWFLWLFGNNVEDRLGHLAFLLFYLFGGLLATVGHWWTHPGSTMPVVGASGAVAAVLGGYLITWPWARIHTLVFLFIFVTVVDLPAMLVLGLWFVLQVFSGAQASSGSVAAGVAWWAHVAGFVAGMVLMPVIGDLFAADREPRLAVAAARGSAGEGEL